MDRYVQLTNMGGDCCGMGLASEFPEEYEDENTTSRASNQEWVGADAAQSRIAELEAEVGRLRGVNTNDIFDLINQAHNAALSMADEQIDGWPDVYGDNPVQRIRALRR